MQRPLSRTLAALALVAFVAPALAEDPTPGFPANSAGPASPIAPAKGLPDYDGDSDPVKRDQVAGASGEAEADGSRPKSQAPMLFRFGRTIVTPFALGLDQRIPVSMRDGAEGRMSAWTYGGETSLRHISENFVTYGNFDYHHTDYAFDTPAGAPWNDTDQYRLNAHAEWNVAGKWWLFANGGGKIAYEQDAAAGEALTGRLAAGFKYRFIPEFSYYVGVNVMTRLDRDPLIIPMTAFDIRIGRWSARSLNGLAVYYDASGDNSLVLDMSALFDTSDFRLRNDGSGSRRVVEFQEVPITFGITKTFAEHCFVRVSATFIAWSDYRFRTDSATTGDFQTSPGLSFGFASGLTF